MAKDILVYGFGSTITLIMLNTEFIRLAIKMNGLACLDHGHPIIPLSHEL